MIDKIKLTKKINTLETRIEELEQILKEELYIQFMNDYKLKSSNDILKKENTKLRKQLKELKKARFENE